MSLSDLGETLRRKIVAGRPATVKGCSGRRGRQSTVTELGAVKLVTPRMVESFSCVCGAEAMDEASSPWLYRLFPWLRAKLAPSKDGFQWAEYIPQGLSGTTWEWARALPGETPSACHRRTPAYYL